MLWQFLTLVGVFLFIFLVIFVQYLGYKRQIIIKINENHKEYNQSEADQLFEELSQQKFRCVNYDTDKPKVVFARQDWKKFRKKDYFEKDSLMILGKHGIHVRFR